MLAIRNLSMSSCDNGNLLASELVSGGATRCSCSEDGGASSNIGGCAVTADASDRALLFVSVLIAILPRQSVLSTGDGSAKGEGDMLHKV